MRSFQGLDFYRVSWAPNTVRYLTAGGDRLVIRWLAESCATEWKSCLFATS
eukprot:jgi/Botrbrau1/18945/Bobra.0632s0001.1